MLYSIIVQQLRQSGFDANFRDDENSVELGGKEHGTDEKQIDTFVASTERSYDVL